MAIDIRFSPVPIVHSAAYHVYVRGLVPTNAIRINNYSSEGGTGFADTAVTGNADANGEFAASITAQTQVGNYELVVEDTTAEAIVAVASFIVT